MRFKILQFKIIRRTTIFDFSIFISCLNGYEQVGVERYKQNKTINWDSGHNILELVWDMGCAKLSGHEPTS